MHSVYNIIFIATLIIHPRIVQSSNKVGNGGNVVQCLVAGKRILQLLDFYENNVSPNSVGKAANEIAEKKLKKLQEVAPKITTQYTKRLSQIPREIDFKNEIQILEIPDSKHLFKPLTKNCEVVQIAVRKNMISSLDKRFLIRKDLWDKLPAAHQAGLLTHEIIHEHLTKLGEENSIKARRINAFLYASNSNMKDFWKLIRDLEVPIYP